MDYYPKEFWLKAGKSYLSRFRYNKSFHLQEQMLIEYLRKLQFDSVLEVGCGFGRITKEVIRNFPVKQYLAVDLSPDQIRNAQRYIKTDLTLNFAVSEIQLMKPKRRFDLVLACEVLMHIIPQEIVNVINILVQTASKHVVNVDWFEEDRISEQQRADTWNFVHPYESLYKNIPCVNQVSRIPISKNNLDVRQSIFHAVIL